MPGGRTLEPELPEPEIARPAPEPAQPAAPPPPPPGFRAQIGATKDALVRLAVAHIDLAKAEADEIKGEVGRAAALGGLAIGAGILLALFLPIGGMLFLGEWIFGSIGWGLLLGTELLIALAVTAVLVALRVPGLIFDALAALLIALIVGVVLGLSLPYQLFLRLGEALGIPTDIGLAALYGGLAIGAIVGVVVGLIAWRSQRGVLRGVMTLVFLVLGVVLGAVFGALVGGALGWVVGLFIAGDVRPRLTGMAIVAVVGAIGGLIAGLRGIGGGRGAIGGLVVGAVIGGIVGGILAVDYGPRIGAAFGTATFYIAWVVLMLLRLKRQGIDMDTLKSRFWPQETIDTTKESIEWAKARLPLGPKS